jgi:alpha-1,2-mannosyltransferase
MLGQSLGSMALGWEALCEVVPDVFVDSMGYAFVLPIAKWLAGCRVGCYVHYPTISTDMLSRVERREGSFNNDDAVSRSAALTTAKLVYYRLFARMYGAVGSSAEVVLVNSRWTHDHIVSLWRRPDVTSIVYPPCNTLDLETIPLDGRAANPAKIVSVAQFRPEKNHALQLRSFARFIALNPGQTGKVELVMLGGCRNDGDRARVAALEALRRELGLDECVRILTNLPYAELKRKLREATLGIHTMRDEHFGIGEQPRTFSMLSGVSCSAVASRYLHYAPGLPLPPSGHTQSACSHCATTTATSSSAHSLTTHRHLRHQYSLPLNYHFHHSPPLPVTTYHNR